MLNEDAEILPNGAPPPRNPRNEADTTSMRAGNRAYLSQLRACSSYPVFRKAVSVCCFLGYSFVALLALGALYTMFASSFLWGFGMLVGAALFWALVRVGYELAHMIADGCDALVSMGAKQETLRR